MDVKCNIVCGCQKSQLDGTEHIAEWEDFDIPESFSWQYVMPPVRDQGKTSTCVCQTLTGNLDFFYNSLVGTPGVCNDFSIDELYSQRLDKTLDGMQIKTALKYLKRYGLKNVSIDSYAFVKNSIIMRNSWGLSWGNNGYMEVPYEDFIKYCFECWTFTL